MAATFRYATLDEYPAVSRFLDEHWAKGHIYCRSKTLFDWTFRGHGQWEEEGYSLAVAEDQGELVGILGGIPFILNSFGRKSKAVWIVNYVIRPDHRRGTTALQLLSMFRRPPFQAVIAFGINPATSVIYRVLRGQVLPEIPRHFAVLPNNAGRMVNLLTTAYPDWPGERARALAESFELKSIPESTPEFAQSIPPLWDEEHWPAFAAAMVGAERSVHYLKWRYADHPVFDYRFIAVADGPRVGLAVWRLETIRVQTPAGRQDFDTIGRLLEFLPTSAENARQLAGCFLREVCASGAFGADYYGYHGETRTWLQEAGFAAVGESAEERAVPSRFQPLDGKGGGILSAVFVPEGSPQVTTAPDCPWYWTRSDSDQDRPN